MTETLPTNRIKNKTKKTGEARTTMKKETSFVRSVIKPTLVTQHFTHTINKNMKSRKA